MQGNSNGRRIFLKIWLLAITQCTGTWDLIFRVPAANALRRERVRDTDRLSAMLEMSVCMCMYECVSVCVNVCVSVCKCMCDWVHINVCECVRESVCVHSANRGGEGKRSWSRWQSHPRKVTVNSDCRVSSLSLRSRPPSNLLLHLSPSTTKRQSE